MPQDVTRYRVDVGGCYSITKPLTKNAVISYAYSKAVPDKPVSVETLEGDVIVRFTLRS